MKILQNTVDIWIFDIDEFNCNITNIDMLDTHEMKKLNSFHKMEDKNRYLFSHIALRLILSYYSPNINPKDWKIVYNKYGKPELLNNNQLFFNFSRTKNCISFIFNNKYKCGIDIEKIRDITLSNIIDEVFTYEEKKLYLITKKQTDLFYVLWTLKEAFLKTIGKGFSISPNTIDFSCIKETNLFKRIFFIKDGYQHTAFKLDDKYLSFVIETDKYIKYRLMVTNKIRYQIRQEFLN